MEDSGNNPRRMAVHTVGAGRPLVLFHGGMGSWNHWFAISTRLRHAALDTVRDGRGLGWVKLVR